MKNSELFSLIDGYSIIVLFGVNDYGMSLYQFLTMSKVEKNVIFCDNSRRKIKENKLYNVQSVEDVVNKYPSAVFLLMSMIHSDNMRNQLLELGVDNDNIHIGITEEVISEVDVNRGKCKRKPLDMLQFEVDIVSHCNLNCKCCSQFSSIAKPEYIDIEEMRRDFRRLGDLFHGTAKRIYLIGGEPLLHRQLDECMRIARDSFPNGDISVFTNGIQLQVQNDIFWTTCRLYNISLIVTKYPISLEYEKLRELADKKGVKFHFFGASEDFKYMTNLGLDIEGKQNPEQSFSRCPEANNCIKLKNGKLYTCTRPAAIYKFNDFFHQNLNVSRDDYIDIHAEISGEEILKKIASPIPFCRYCNFSGNKKAMKWGHTEGKIEEWL